MRAWLRSACAVGGNDHRYDFHDRRAAGNKAGSETRKGGGVLLEGSADCQRHSEICFTAWRPDKRISGEAGGPRSTDSGSGQAATSIAAFGIARADDRKRRLERGAGRRSGI